MLEGLHRHETREPRVFHRRSLAVAVLFTVILLGLLIGVANIQIIDGRDLAWDCVRSRSNWVSLESLDGAREMLHSRGMVLDRNGISLTGAFSRWRVIAIRQLFLPQSYSQDGSGDLVPDQLAPEAAERLKGLAKTLGQDRMDLKKEIEAGTVVKLSEVSQATAHHINGSKWPGIVVMEEVVRYGDNPLAQHVVGYLGYPDHNETRRAGNGSRLAGIDGVERSFDNILSGGAARAIVAYLDGHGSIVPGLGIRLREGGGNETDSTVISMLQSIGWVDRAPGDVCLTLDSRAQALVEGVMDRTGVRAGAVVVASPRTGEILAMASRPNYRPDQVGDLVEGSRRGDDGGGALLNRALGGSVGYIPGSVFKLVVAAAALENRTLTPSETIYCEDGIQVGDRFFECRHPDGDGSMNLIEALAYSCNSYFVKVALEVGSDAILEKARELGLGSRVGVRLPGEAEGLLPSGGLGAGDLANLAIGQGELLVTPLQVAQLVSTIVNNGVQVPLHIFKEVRAGNGFPVTSYSGGKSERVMRAVVATYLRQGMEAVARSGTGKQAWVEPWGCGVKTGSAETGQVGPNGNPLMNAWTAGYVPQRDPKYVIVVLVEGGGYGGLAAAPIFRDIVAGLIEIRVSP